MRPPTRPDWRWVTYHALIGNDGDKITDEVLRFARYLREHYDNPIEAIDAERMRRSHQEDVNDPDVVRALHLRNEPPIRDVLRRMLQEHCDLELIQDAIFRKFKENLSVDTIEIYRDFFWDTDTLNSYEFGQFYASSEMHRPDPPPVGGVFREKWVAFQQGAQIDDFSLDKAMERMFQRAFFRSEELAQYRGAADDRVLDFQNSATKIYKAIRKEGGTNEDTEELPEEFDQEIEYPDDTAYDKREIEGADHDDPNDIELDEVPGHE